MQESRATTCTANTPVNNVNTFSIVLDFGQVASGEKSRKTFRIKNDSKKMESYIVKRDPNINPIYQVFDFDKYYDDILPDQHLEIKVTFRPCYPNGKFLDNFNIIDKSGNVYKIGIKGQSKGPQVVSSVSSINFYITPSENVKKTIFELKNEGSVPAYFQFDNCNEESVFKVTPSNGKLEAFRYKFITVTFEPTLEKVVYADMLICLILNQEPLLINLFGLYDQKFEFLSSEITFTRYHETNPEINNFNVYLADSVKICREPPPISLSELCLDFGCVPVGESRTMTTCITNHMADEVSVIWIQKTGIYKITPDIIDLPSGESVLYECTFLPTTSDQFYNRTLTAFIEWKDNRPRPENKTKKSVCCMTIPIAVHLRVTGNSFVECKRWIPCADLLSPNIILPPTIPNQPTYGTFLLNDGGVLPVSFKMVPPKNTNYTVKPMLGCTKSFQVFVVQLHPDLDENKAYIEYWSIEFNGKPETNLPIYFKSYSAYPSVVVGERNIVEFPPVQLYCQHSAMVGVKNTSVHYIRYNFLSFIDYLKIDFSSGELVPNETIFIPWYVTGIDNMPETATLQCLLTMIQSSKIDIIAIPITVTLNTSCSESILCAMPKYKDYGEVEWGTKDKMTFHIFNFGVTSVHFSFFCLEHQSEMDPNIINVSPARGTINAKDKMEILIEFTAALEGPHIIEILYKERQHADSPFFVPERQKTLYTMKFNCIYPYLQIVDIPYHNFAATFSKMALWRALNIEQINEHLYSLHCDESANVDSYLPDYEELAPPNKIILAIKNVSPVFTWIKLKRKKACNCKLVQISKGISKRGRTYQCQHRELLEIEQNQLEIGPEVLMHLTLIMKYHMVGKNILIYKMILPHNRTIEWIFHIQVLKKNTNIPSIYTHEFNFRMKNTYLKLHGHRVQSFKFYNDTSNIVRYAVDTRQIEELNRKFGYKIMIICSITGIIQPFQVYHLLYKFQPLKRMDFTLYLPIMLGNRSIELAFTGRGYKTLPIPLNEDPLNIQKIPYRLNIHAPVELSTCHLAVENLLTWHKAQRIIFIKNLTSNRVIVYGWEEHIVEGVLTVKANVMEELLRPKESHAVFIEVEAYDKPCDLDFLFPCKFVDYTEWIEHRQSLLDYIKHEKDLDGQFIITESGTSYPENTVVVKPRPRLQFVSVEMHITIISVCDRDIFMPVSEQLYQHPLRLLQPDIDRMITNVQYLKDTEHPITSFAIDAIKKKDSELFQKVSSYHMAPEKVHTSNVDELKFIIERILADVVFSNLFKESVRNLQHEPGPFYLQTTVDYSKLTGPQSSSYHTVTSEHLTKYEDKFRKDNILSAMERPQPILLVNTFKHLIKETFHEAFKLGPAAKNHINMADLGAGVLTKFACGCEEIVEDVNEADNIEGIIEEIGHGDYYDCICGSEAQTNC